MDFEQLKKIVKGVSSSPEADLEEQEQHVNALLPPDQQIEEY